jgi:hypothetical protein
MAEQVVFPIFWTERALQNALSIKRYLLAEFSPREVENFYSLLQAFEMAVTVLPKLYPSSTIKKNIRRAVLSNVSSAFYRVHKKR